MRTRLWLYAILLTILVSGGFAFDIGYGNGWIDGESITRQRDSILISNRRDLSRERDSIVSVEAFRAGVPINKSLAISHTENWIGDSTAVSTSGAVGLMQIMPSYWENAFPDQCYGVGNLFNRKRNACVGVRVLRHYYIEHGNWDQAVRSYLGTTDSVAENAYVERFERHLASIMGSE